MIRDKAQKILQPEYYSSFCCDPDKCSETCCERWQIIIDKKTYESCIQSDNAVIKEIAKTGLARNESSVSDDDYAVVNLNNELVCPFLNSKGLCEIFINLGEGSLSKTCKSYPRAVIRVDDTIERGLEMSCSVAAELALLNEKGIRFETVLDRVEQNDIYVISPAALQPAQIEIVKEIRNSIIDILQNRRTGLDERMAALGSFLHSISEDIDLSNLGRHEALTAIKEAKALEESWTSSKKAGLHHCQDKKQFHHLNTMLSLKFKEGDSIRFFSKRYIECLMQVLDAFGRVKEKELESHYHRSFERYLKPYMSQKSFILENFLVNFVFVYSIELFKLKDIWTMYMKLCVIYGLLKFNLVGLAVYHKGMKDELMLKLIQSLSKTLITDKVYLDSAVKYLQKEGLDEPDKLTALFQI